MTLIPVGTCSCSYNVYTFAPLLCSFLMSFTKQFYFVVIDVIAATDPSHLLVSRGSNDCCLPQADFCGTLKVYYFGEQTYVDGCIKSKFRTRQIA